MLNFLTQPKPIALRALFATLFLTCIHAAFADRARLETAYFVNWQYPRQDDLKGWFWTAHAIQRTLVLWGLANDDPPQIVQGSATAFSEFVQKQESRKPGLIYLASHQTKNGSWDFPDKTSQPLAPDFERLMQNGSPIIVLDACHAGAVMEAIQKGKSPSKILLAARSDQKTYELNFKRHRPYDAPRRLPQLRDWLKRELPPNWDGRISFLGMAWVTAFLNTPSAPKNEAEWTRFLTKVCEAGHDFRENESKRFSSDLILLNPD